MNPVACDIDSGLWGKCIRGYLRNVPTRNSPAHQTLALIDLHLPRTERVTDWRAPLPVPTIETLTCYEHWRQCARPRHDHAKPASKVATIARFLAEMLFGYAR